MQGIIFFRTTTLLTMVFLAKVYSLHMDVLRAYSFPTQSCLSKTPQEVVLPRGNIRSIILNVDGRTLINPCVAGFEGLIRDHNGKFH